MSNKYKEIIYYLIFGVLTTVVSLATYYALVYTILDPNKPIELQVANVVSWIFAVTFAYLTNRKFVFDSTNPNVAKEAIKFYFARITSLLVDMLLMYILVTRLNYNDKIIKIIVQVVIIILNYILSKLIVFKKESSES